ncbi:cysteine peptidase family C39 domain-containing protein, partial [Methylobacterium ajmalii]
MVARSLGSTITLDELRQISPVSSRGTTLKNVIEAAAYADVTARPIRCEPAALKNIEMPAILHWKFNHFVVLNNVKRGSYEVIDPAGGRGWVEIQELSRCFTGIAIEIKRAAKFTPRKPNSDISFLHLIKMLFADRMLASSCLTSSILVLSAEVGSIVVYQVFIDKIIRSGSSDALYLIALLFVAMLIIAVAARYIRASSARMLVSNFDLQLSTYVAHRLLHLPLSFHLSRTHSEIMRYVRSARPIRQAASVGFVEVILDAMSILLLSLVIYFYSPIIWFSMLGIILLYALFRIFRLRYVRDVLVSYSVNDMHESSVLQENTRSVETIKLYAAEQIRHVIWRQSYHKVSSTESVLENCRQEDAILG